MHATTSCIQHPNDYSSFLSYTRHHHHLNTNTSLTHLPSYNTDLDMSSHSSIIKQFESDDKADNQSLSSSLGDTNNSSLLPSKKRSRAVPAEEKNVVYYEKRARNNESAKRSRNSRRIKEEEIQERVTILEHENLRLTMENETIRYRISQFHALHGVPSKSLQ